LLGIAAVHLSSVLVLIFIDGIDWVGGFAGELVLCDHACIYRFPQRKSKLVPIHPPIKIQNVSVNRVISLFRLDDVIQENKQQH
jgi:hypothetical protein